MATKKGAGGKQQNYNEQNGEYSSDGGAKTYRQNASYQDILSGKALQILIPNKEKYIDVTPKSEVDNYALRISKPRNPTISKPPQKEDEDFPLTSPKDFRKALINAKESNVKKERWKVETHKQNDYENCDCFVNKDGSTVAVELTGDNKGNIISVCKNQNTNERGVLNKLLTKAVENGGDRLDAFGETLFKKYQNFGFEPVSWTPFSTEYAPEGWVKQYGAKKNPIIFYRYVGKGKTSDISFTDFLKNGKQFEGKNGYDEAQRYRNEEIKKWKTQ